jgi:hypothetical protein
MAHDTFTTDGKLLYQADLTALNNSGVAGKALFFIDQDAQTLTVDIRAMGLEPGEMHIQHIHGFTDDTDAKTPGLAQDDDRDGFVELAEGLDTYGPIQLNLTLDPKSASHDHGTEGHDHTAEAVFPTVGADGLLNYRQTFHFDSDDENAQVIFDGITPLEAKEIVLHGLTLPEGFGVGTAGEVDGTGGYKLILPVASGELMGIAPAADVLAAVDELGLMDAGIIDWNALAGLAQANFEATGSWFI